MGNKRSDYSKRKATEIRIRLLPRSSVEGIVGMEGDVYRVKVTAPPVNGKANSALISFLSKKLRRPKRDIEIKTGRNSRLKLIHVHGLSRKEITKLLA